MGRLAFAPKSKDIEITDLKRGLATFAPRPEKHVSFAALREALKRAGYTLASAEIEVAGTLRREAEGWSLVADNSAQTFVLDTDALKQKKLEDGARAEVGGGWTTAGAGRDAREKIAVTSIIQPEAAHAEEDSSAVSFTRVAFAPRTRARASSAPQPLAGAGSFAPIRTTSPGLTVYGGGAVTPRFTFTRQRLGDLEVNRQSLSLNVSYTPTPRLQLEAEATLSRTSYDDGARTGAGTGFGNVIVSGKYRFYRAVGEWGDRQAALRFGLELPTGSKRAPDAARLPRATPFVRQQLSAISGGLAAHADLSYSQARGRMIFGGNVEGVLRGERAGFRTGHELRANTDLEFVVFPFDYRRPTGEVFAILETNFVRRGAGRVDGREVADSSATEFYVAPALQYVASPRVVFEASVQLPVARRAGAQVLRTSGSVLLGARYLF
ncbi:MAG TPA: hypothetical protein VE360_04025 [Pyrinomonadaceae bacterium]|nr:hypothetical protein [Pyrinomonadaceae bacterium]